MPYTEPPIKTGCKSSDSKTMQGHHKLIWSNWNDRWQCDNKGCSFKTKEKPRKEVKQNVTEIKGRPTAKKDRESSNQKSRQEPVKELKVGFFSGMFGNSADKKAAEEFRKRNKGR